MMVVHDVAGDGPRSERDLQFACEPMLLGLFEGWSEGRIAGGDASESPCFGYRHSIGCEDCARPAGVKIWRRVACVATRQSCGVRLLEVER